MFKKLNIILPIFSGILTAISFSIPGLWFLCFFSLIPLYLIVLKTSNKISLCKIMLLYSIGYYIPLLFWLFELTPLLPFGKYNRFTLFFGIIIIALLQGAYFLLATFIFTHFKSEKVTDVFIFSLLFSLGEWFQEITPILPFSWGKVGLIASGFTPFIQSASVFGVIFISFLILTINGCIAFAILNYKIPRKAFMSFSIGLAIFLINNIFGVLYLSTEKEPASKLEVCLVQGNFGGENKWGTTPTQMLDDYISLTKSGITEKTSLVIWPETAVPLFLDENPNEKNKLLAFSKKENVTVILGVNHKTFDPDLIYNSMVAVSPSGEISLPYSKQVLVPMGEYLPFEKLIKGVTSAFDNVNYFTGGDDNSPIKTSVGDAGGIICFESIFANIARGAVLNGAKFLALISNDSWFGDTPALYQHHANAIFRAVENKRFVLRASNTGVTSIITPFGKVQTFAKPLTAATLVGNFYLEDNFTIYSFIGNTFILSGVALHLIGFLQKLKRKRKK